MKLGHWFHHLFNPHCVDCEHLEQEHKVCQSCETLKMQLSIANIEKKQLLDSILSFTKPTVQSVTQVRPEDVQPKIMTWNVRKQMLEAEDRKTASLMQDKEKIQRQIDELEKEVGIEKETENVSSI